MNGTLAMSGSPASRVSAPRRSEPWLMGSAMPEATPRRRTVSWAAAVPAWPEGQSLPPDVLVSPVVKV